ncbi:MULTISPECIES: glycosyltransferase [unclassified Pseudomonas]|uniref:glycosyltransferase n=1 Tax=unclassified Pseudomonas TaxID=196821 RepID=UPI001F5A5093|nr:MULTISPECIES: glycosyltransferase [unclassified Pseudomonas]
MPVKHPKIAVLLAAYNGTQWIEEQLATIIGQLFVDIAVYISIDPSVDGTEEWCAAYAALHQEVHILPAAGKFGGASRNFFRLIRDVDFKDYDYIAFADQDDRWHEDKLHRAICAIESLEVDAYSSNVTAFWSDGKTCLLDKAQPQVAWDYLFEAAGPGCTYVMSSNLMGPLKASVLDNWQLLQAVSLHDWYCYAFTRSQGFRWHIDPAPSMDYRQHAANQIGANKGLSPLLARFKSIHNGWWFSQVQLIASLVGERSDPFIRICLKLHRKQLVKLSFSAWKCRRRLRDKFLFFLICWLAALIGKQAK